MRRRLIGLILLPILVWLGVALFGSHASADSNTPTRDANCPYTICNSTETNFVTYDFYGDHVVAHFLSGDITFNLASSKPQSVGGDMIFTSSGASFCNPTGGTTEGSLDFQYQSADNDLHGRTKLNYYNIATKTCTAGSQYIRPSGIFDRTGKDPCPADGNKPGCAGPPAVGSTTNNTGGDPSASPANPTTATTNTAGGCPKTTFFFIPTWYEYLKCDKTFGGPANFNFPDDIPAVALAVIDMLMRLAGLVAIVAIIGSGVEYITAGGAPEKTASSRRRIYNSLIGLAVVAIASGFIRFIGDQLGG